MRSTKTLNPQLDSGTEIFYSSACCMKKNFLFIHHRIELVPIYYLNNALMRMKHISRHQKINTFNQNINNLYFLKIFGSQLFLSVIISLKINYSFYDKERQLKFCLLNESVDVLQDIVKVIYCDECQGCVQRFQQSTSCLRGRAREINCFANTHQVHPYFFLGLFSQYAGKFQ